MDFVLQGTFQDFDLFADVVKAWDLDFVQLDAGAPSYEILMAGTKNVHICQTKFNRKIYQQGSAPIGRRTIGIPLNPDIDLKWYGQNVTGNDIMVFPDNGELISISLPQFDAIAYSIDCVHLERICTELELPEFDDLIAHRTVFRVPNKVMQVLRSRVNELLFCLKGSNNEIVGHRLFIDELENALARRFVRAIAYSQDLLPQGMPKYGTRSSCVKSAIDYLSSDPSNQTVTQICHVANVSERTLQYAFKEEFGITPKQFVKARNLNLVRRALCLAGEGSSLSEIVRAHNIRHHGQFASDYRKLFGELPRETFTRNK